MENKPDPRYNPKQYRQARRPKTDNLPEQTIPKPTPKAHRTPIWRHPKYLAFWEHLPYWLQVELLRIEAILDDRFKRRLHIVRRADLHWLKTSVLGTIIMGLAGAVLYLLHL